MQSINVYGFINGTQRIVLAAATLEDAIQLAFQNCEIEDGFLQYEPSPEEISFLMSASRTGVLH